MNLIELGEAIKQARLEQGIQQEELCAYAQLSRATLSRLENGRLPELGVRKIMALCERLALELTLQPVSKRPTLRSLAKESAEQERSRYGLGAMGARGPKIVAVQPLEGAPPLRKRVRRAKTAQEGDA